MRFGHWRGAALALALTFSAATGLSGAARADGFGQFCTIPRTVQAVDKDGNPYLMPPIPYGHYAKKHDFLGSAGMCLGALCGLTNLGACCGTGCNSCGDPACGNCGGQGCGNYGGQGCGNYGGQGGGPFGGCNPCGRSGFGLFSGNSCNPCNTGNPCGGFGGGPCQGGPSMPGCGRRGLFGPRNMGCCSGTGAVSCFAPPSPQKSCGPVGSSQCLMSPQGGSPCGMSGCCLQRPHYHRMGRGCNACGGTGCGICQDPSMSSANLCSSCHGGGCNLCGGDGLAGCNLCGGRGCASCCGLPTGLVGGLLAKALHLGEIKYFVGPGGPVPLTPGYVPYVVVTRSPRDFFAFPPFSDLDP